MRILAYLLFTISVIMLVSCEKNNDDDVYSYDLSVTGDTTNVFSETGEEREYILQLISIPKITPEQAETILKSSDIVFKSEHNRFSVSDSVIIDNTIRLKIKCNENIVSDTIADRIDVVIAGPGLTINTSFYLSQAGSDIRYEYKIVSEYMSDFTIPNEGGVFKIPIKCSRIKYLNSKYVLEEPCSLSGIRYKSSIVNAAWVHSDRIYSGVNPGDYVIELNASQPFNIDGKFSWWVGLFSNNISIYNLNIFHNQTPGEEYFIGTSSFFKSEILQ